jgi:hypothetical protein
MCWLALVKFDQRASVRGAVSLPISWGLSVGNTQCGDGGLERWARDAGEPLGRHLAGEHDFRGDAAQLDAGDGLEHRPQQRRRRARQLHQLLTLVERRTARRARHGSTRPIIACRLRLKSTFHVQRDFCLRRIETLPSRRSPEPVTNV